MDLIHLADFLLLLTKVCDSLFGFNPAYHVPSERGSTLKGKNWLPFGASSTFLK